MNARWTIYSTPSTLLGLHTLSLSFQIHGVIWKRGRGVPPLVFRDEVKGKQANAVQGTVKAAVLKDDSLSHDLIIASCYDQKPFYMISHSIDQVTWVECEKRIWSHLLKRNVLFKFLRWNLSDDYNYEMNNNDIADQLRLVYRLQRFQCNEKWWWVLFMWGFEVTLANAYMMMQRYCELKCTRVPYSHHDFQEKVGLAYLDPNKHWPCRKSPPKLLAISHKTPKSKQQIPWAPRLDNNALCPDTGQLKNRLDTTLNHMPIVPLGKKGDANCQLHRWAHKMQTSQHNIPPGARQHVMMCRECCVNICLRCWELFHSEPNLSEKICDILAFK